MTETLYSGRFEEGLAPAAKAYSYTLRQDLALVHYDIRVNQVHAQLLERAGILSSDESETLQSTLADLDDAFAVNPEELLGDDEDIHACIERLVTERCGELGKKIHSGKSRNDQVITDARMYCKTELKGLKKKVRGVIRQLLVLAEENIEVVFPGFTHFQVAQPVLFSHHCLAYVAMLERDLLRLDQAYVSSDVCPLGSAALAGNSYGLDRDWACQALDFARLSENSMDAVSDRDFLMETLSAISLCMLHLSRLAEELVLWSSDLIGFVSLGEDYSTGSSIMPQKKNPDIAELLRGKTAKTSANVMAMQQLIKSLPLAYNRDLQEDKPLVYESVAILSGSLTCMTGMLASLQINQDAISAVFAKGYSLATELADYLVKKGLPFRDCHRICAEIVRYAIEQQKPLEALSLEEFQSKCGDITEDVFSVLTLDAALAVKSVYGGTAPEQVRFQLKRLKEVYL